MPTPSTFEDHRKQATLCYSDDQPARSTSGCGGTNQTSLPPPIDDPFRIEVKVPEGFHKARATGCSPGNRASPPCRSRRRSPPAKPAYVSRAETVPDPGHGIRAMSTKSPTRARGFDPACVEAALPEPRRTGAASNFLSIFCNQCCQVKMEAAPVRLGSQRAASTQHWMAASAALASSSCYFCMCCSRCLRAGAAGRVYLRDRR